MRLKKLCATVVIPLLCSAPALAQDKPERPTRERPTPGDKDGDKDGRPPRGAPGAMQPGMRDRVPLQIRERDPRAGGKGQPNVPFKGAPGAAGGPPGAPGAAGGPQRVPPGGAPGAPVPPVPAPSPPTPPLPGATSIMGNGKTRVDVTPVLENGNGKTAADVDENKRRNTGKALFNFENAQLIDVVKQISKLTGKNFILRENLKGQKLTILCEEPVTSKDAYRAFLVALEINNLAVVQAGKFLKIEERKNSIKQPIPTFFQNDAELPGDESMVTYIHQLKYVEIDQAQKLVDSMLNKAVGDLQVYQPNLLIMSDSAVNISRIRKLIEKIDVSGFQTRIHILDIEFAPASDIANKLTALFDPNKTAQKKAPVRGKNGEAAAPAPAEKPGAPPSPAAGNEGTTGLEDYFITKIIADERTNKLIIVGTEESFNKVKALVELLDVPEGPSNAPQVHVHPLENADGEKLTQALQNLAQAGKKPNEKGKKGQPADASMFEGEIKISADPATNSLVIIASQRDYQSLAKVIRRLDVRRPQVFVEAVIMEVTLDRVTDLGLDWFTAYQAPVPGLGTGTGIVANPGGQTRLTNGLRAATVDPTGLSSFLGFLAFRGPGVPVRVGNQTVDLPSFGAVLNALEQDGNVDVLSTPHILTTDNVKAEILVGQTVPFQSGISPSLGGAAGVGSFLPIVNVQRQDVALKFVITPHVNTSNFVRLELDQEVSDLGAVVEVSPGNKQPTTTKRTAKTTVVVKDEQTVIIGGLISDKKSRSEAKIPVLGDVPWLGFLFRTPHEELRKTNLMIILTPHIIRSDEDFRRIYERKLQERQEFIQEFYGVNAPYLGPVDFERKVGAYGALHGRIRDEMMKVENGGPGLPGEAVITPESTTLSKPGESSSEELPEGLPEGEEGKVEGATGTPPEGEGTEAQPGQPGGDPGAAAPPPADAPPGSPPPAPAEPPPPELQ